MVQRCVFFICALLLLPLVAFAGSTWRLSEGDVIQRILKTHLQIEAAQTDADIAAADLRAAKGTFDTHLSATVDHRIDKSASMAPAIFGNRKDTTTIGAEAKTHWPTGTETTLGYLTTRERTDGSAFINPREFESRLSLGVRQPLLKNMAGVADRRFVAQARAALQSAETQVQRKVHEALRAGLGFYWQYCFATREVQVAQQAVRAAEAFVSITDERYRLGTADGTDLLAAKANVATRKATLLAAQAAVEAALRGVKTELQIPVEETVAATAGLPPLRQNLLAEATAISKALANRPDYLALQHRAEQMNLRLDMAQSRRWPSLDLVSSLALNQLSTRSYGDAIAGTDNPNVAVGLQFQVPLQNRRARGERDRAAHEKARTLIDLKTLENQIVHEVEERLASLRLFAQQVAAQGQAETLQQNRVDLEQEQYQLGRSSSTEVIRAQDDYLVARQATIRARQTYQQAWLDYQLATAQLP